MNVFPTAVSKFLLLDFCRESNTQVVMKIKEIHELISMFIKFVTEIYLATTQQIDFVKVTSSLILEILYLKNKNSAHCLKYWKNQVIATYQKTVTA